MRETPLQKLDRGTAKIVRTSEGYKIVDTVRPYFVLEVTKKDIEFSNKIRKTPNKHVISSCLAEYCPIAIGLRRKFPLMETCRVMPKDTKGRVDVHVRFTGQAHLVDCFLLEDGFKFATNFDEKSPVSPSKFKVYFDDEDKEEMFKWFGATIRKEKVSEN